MIPKPIIVVPGSIPNIILSFANLFVLLCVVSLRSHKTKQFLWAAVKIIILLLAGFFVYQKLIDADFWLLESHLAQMQLSTIYFYIILLVFISMINWAIEVKKWQLLVSIVRKISFSSSCHQVLVAHFVGFITPAKAGDYGAKALFYQKNERKKILFLNFLGNMYQLLATLFFGLLGLGIIAFSTSGSAIFFWGIAVMMCLLFYFIFPRFLNRIKWSLGGSNWAKVRTFLKTIPSNTKRQARSLSFIRYLVFAHEFYFVLWLLGNEQSYVFAMACISAVYILSSVIPIMQLFDLVVRGGTAIIVFGWFSVSEEIVLSAVLVMWILNVFLPLVPGVYFLLSRRRIPSTNTLSQ